jgi:hypothetical protein
MMMVMMMMMTTTICVAANLYVHALNRYDKETKYKD